MKHFSHKNIYSTYKMEVPAEIMRDVGGYLITLRKRDVTGKWGRKQMIALFRELTLE
jgi:hypothetical protein